MSGENADPVSPPRASGGDPFTAPAADPAVAASATAAEGASKRRVRNVLIMAGGAMLIVFAVGYSMFAPDTKMAARIPAELKGARQPDVKSAPGGDGKSIVVDSPAYQTMAEQAERKRVQEAETGGGSVQPSFQSGVVGRTPGTFDPLQPIQPAQPAVPQRPNFGTPTAAQSTQMAIGVTGPGTGGAYGAAPNDDARIQEIRRYVSSLDRKFAEPERVVFTVSTGEGGPQANQGPGGPATTTSSAAASAAQKPVTLIRAGTIGAVQVEILCDTSMPGPVFATLLTGEWAGSTLVGQCGKAPEAAKISFTSISLKGTDVTLPIDAFALDPETTSSGVATEVDRKLFARYVLKPAAKALEVVGRVAERAGTSVSTNGASTTVETKMPTGRDLALVAGGGFVSQINADTNAINTEPVARVRPKSVLGVAFGRDVIYTPASTAQAQPASPPQAWQVGDVTYTPPPSPQPARPGGAPDRPRQQDVQQQGSTSAPLMQMPAASPPLSR